VPIVIVQHMPPVFTRQLADRLSAGSTVQVAEGQHGLSLKAGHAALAPGDYHMKVARQGTNVVVQLNQDPPENSCRPSADVLFRSVAAVYGPHALAVVLTGMGYDGLHGVQHIKTLRAERAYDRMPVLMVTSETEPAYIVRALAAGADEYTMKPFTADAIAEKLKMIGVLA
jgi:DNA-binding response OmpR family regulator